MPDVTREFFARTGDAWKITEVNYLCKINSTLRFSMHEKSWKTVV